MPLAITEAWEAFGRIDIVVPNEAWQGRNREGRP
jgi:hypothetical protein